MNQLALRSTGMQTTIVAIALLILSACQMETRFRSNFDSTPVGNFPAAAQGIGTGAVDGPAGSAVVVTVPDLPGHWVRVSRATMSSPVSGFQGQFDKVGGEGEFTFSLTLMIPVGTDITTVSCEQFGQATNSTNSFIHVDFHEGGAIRVNDGTTTMTYTQGELFTLQISLNIKQSGATANVALGGSTASGEGTFNVPVPFLNQARQFGGVRVWLGANSVGSANATNIVVKQK